MKVTTRMQQGSAQLWFKRSNQLSLSFTTQSPKVECTAFKVISDTNIQGYFGVICMCYKSFAR